MTAETSNLQTARQKFVNDLKKKGRSTATILAYNKDVDQLIEFVLPKKITQPNQLTTQHIENLKNTSLIKNILLNPSPENSTLSKPSAASSSLKN